MPHDINLQSQSNPVARLIVTIRFDNFTARIPKHAVQGASLIYNDVMVRTHKMRGAILMVSE